MNTRDIKNINDLMITLTEDSFYRGYCRSLVYDKYKTDELLAEMYLAVLEWPEERILGLCERNELKYYLISCIRNLYNNKSSKFRKATDYNFLRLEHSLKTSDFDTDDDEVLLSQEYQMTEDLSEPTYINQEHANKAVTVMDNHMNHLVNKGKLTWYDVHVFNTYNNEVFSEKENKRFTSFRTMAEYVNVPMSSLWHTYNKTKNLVAKKLNNRYIKIATNDLEF